MPFFSSDKSNSQQYPVHLYLSNNGEDIFVFLKLFFFMFFSTHGFKFHFYWETTITKICFAIKKVQRELLWIRHVTWLLNKNPLMESKLVIKAHAHWTIWSHNLSLKVVFLFQSFLLITVLLRDVNLKYYFIWTSWFLQLVTVQRVLSSQWNLQLVFRSR